MVLQSQNKKLWLQNEAFPFLFVFYLVLLKAKTEKH